MEDKVKTRIKELVPEVMELKFGCVVEIEYTARHLFHHADETFVSNDKYGRWYFLNGELGVMKLQEGNEFTFIESLGSPITLAVVLRAIEKADVGLRVELSTYGDELLMGQYEKPEQQGYYSHAYWNLAKDYDDQSEEAKAFIGKLLGV